MNNSLLPNDLPLFARWGRSARLRFGCAHKIRVIIARRAPKYSGAARASVSAQR
jgi:hypothetical protein